jgi:hypothetical protein
MRKRVDPQTARFIEAPLSPMTVTHGKREITLNSELTFLYRAMVTLNHETDFWELLGIKETVLDPHRL